MRLARTRPTRRLLIYEKRRLSILERKEPLETVPRRHVELTRENLGRHRMGRHSCFLGSARPRFLSPCHPVSE